MKLRLSVLRVCILFAFALLVSVPSSAAEPQEPIGGKRIVSLAPHLTELAFAAGAGSQIVATVEYSDYPNEARAITRIGDAFSIDFERLLALSPDLVLAWESGTPIQTVERIRNLGLRVDTIEIRRLAQIAPVLRSLGELAGTSQIASAAAAQFEREIRALREEYRERKPVSVFLQISARPLYTVNGEHIMSEIVSLCGGTNVFADLNALAPAIGIEAVIAADPDVILSSDESIDAPAEQWKRWTSMRAVREGNIFALPADDLSRPTTRLARGARAVCQALDEARGKKTR